MKNENLFVIGVIVLLFVVGFGIGKVTAPIGQLPLGGTVHNVQETFDAGIAVNGIEVIGSSREISATTISGTTGTLSSTLSTGGKITLSSASSTLQIGNTASGIAPGCIVVGDSGGATSTPVYVTFSYVSGITVATTSPATWCE